MKGNEDQSPPPEYLWGRIKKALKKAGISSKDKLFYKEKVGFNLIDTNK